MEERRGQIAVKYRREMNHNFMIVDAPEREAGGYESKMLVSNGIEGLLKFRIRHYDDKQEFYYEITSKQPLKRLLEQKTIKGREIRSLLLGIAATLHKIEEYLLKEDQFLLDPEYIYIEPERFDVYLCMVPGYSCDFPAAFTSLLQYLLGRTDHQDKDGVVLAYNLYHESLKENYGMPDLLNYLMQEKEVIFGGGFAEEKIEEPEPIFEESNWINQAGMSNQRTEEIQPVRFESARAVEKGNVSKSVERNRENRVKLKNEEKRECITESTTRENIFIKIVKVMLFVAAGEILLWFVMGETGFLKYGAWIGIGIAGIALMAGLLTDKEKQNKVKTNNGKKNKEKENKGKEDKAELDKEKLSKVKQNYNEHESWKMIFDEDQIEDSPTEKKLGREKSDEPETTLLADYSGGVNLVRLESLSRDKESIEISYLPFVIGKYAELTDHCLQQSTVSRLHMRLDKKEGVYIITDLNSTNGTTVNGYQLQANETVSLKNGDTIYVADLGYRFAELIK